MQIIQIFISRRESNLGPSVSLVGILPPRYRGRQITRNIISKVLIFYNTVNTGLLTYNLETRVAFRQTYRNSRRNTLKITFASKKYKR